VIDVVIYMKKRTIAAVLLMELVMTSIYTPIKTVDGLNPSARYFDLNTLGRGSNTDTIKALQFT